MGLNTNQILEGYTESTDESSMVGKSAKTNMFGDISKTIK